jgi:phosphoribosylpyrophosphate synthetase
MTAKACAYALLLLTASASAAPCYSDGDVVTLEGTATRQAARAAEASAKSVWVLSLASPICVNSPGAAAGQKQQSSIDVVQIVDTTPAENSRIQLTGKLVTGNVSGYYAVPTAIWVLKQRVLSGQ